MPEHTNVCVEERMVPEPVFVVIGTLIWLTGRVIPHPVPALLMRLVAPAVGLGKSFHNGLGQPPTLHPMAVVVPGEKLVGCFALLIAHDTIVVDDDALQ